MHRLAASSVVLIILHSVLSVVANVKITPIAVESKGSLKSDLKVEEARYQNPVVPEYYGNSYDRNRQNFVTSNYGSYGAGLSNYDRNGYSSGYGSNNDRYGSQWNRDRVGSGYGASPMNPMDKVNYMPGGVYNPGSSINSYGSSLGGAPGFGNNYGGGSGYGNSGGRFPYEGGSINGPYPSQGGGGPLQGMFPPDLEGKSSLILPLAGAALLGIAAYALVASPAMAMGPMIGKRRKRSLFDEKLEQHMAYRAHRNPAKQV